MNIIRISHRLALTWAVAGMFAVPGEAVPQDLVWFARLYPENADYFEVTVAVTGIKGDQVVGDVQFDVILYEAAGRGSSQTYEFTYREVGELQADKIYRRYFEHSGRSVTRVVGRELRYSVRPLGGKTDTDEQPELLERKRAAPRRFAVNERALEVVGAQPAAARPRAVQPAQPQQAAEAQAGRRRNLTGVWHCDNGGRYFIRHVGNEVWWYGVNDDRISWANVFYGTIRGDEIVGSWADVPSGRARGFGQLMLKIKGSRRLEAIRFTGGFNSTEWSR